MLSDTFPVQVSTTPKHKFSAQAQFATSSLLICKEASSVAQTCLKWLIFNTIIFLITSALNLRIVILMKVIWALLHESQ